MLNRPLHRSVVGGIIGIVLFSVAGAWLLISGISLTLALLCLCIIILFAIILVRRMEKTDRQLENFFISLENHDFNIWFTDPDADPFLSGLFREMNRIMLQFEANQTELEERRLYYESIIRVLTHEIRNSITPIASLSADLIKYIDEYGGKGVIDGLQTIHQQACQLNTFLDAYHRLTHLPDPVKTKVEVRSLFDKISHLLRSEPGSADIRYIVPEGIHFLLDPNLITLALINLIRNALQATAGCPHPQIRVEIGCEAGFSFIQIVDNGEGIPPDRLEDIFTPFYSTKKEGSGIGLPLSARILRLHGGELIVRSIPNEETVFCMRFPAVC